jgi:hypothetical protein
MEKGIMPKPSTQQVIGAIFFCLSVIGIWLIRYEAQNDNHHYLKVWSIVFPIALCLSLAAIIFPGPRAERLQRGEDIATLSFVQIITRRWWKILAIAAMSGALHYWYWYVWKYFFLWKNYGR